MPHPSAPSAATWQTAPEHDFLAFRLISLAELHLDSYFADPAGTEAYQRPSRRASGKAAAPRPLATCERDDATLALAALPAAETFQVSLRSPRFSAVLRAATVEQFSGDIRAAIAAATDWLGAESDLPEETALQAPLEQLAAETPAGAAVTDVPASPVSPAAPPPPTAGDARDVKALVQAKTLPEADWFELVNVLKVAKVPIRPEMTDALAQAAADATPDELSGATPQEISQRFRSLLDDLGTSAESPFGVVEGLAETGTLMPVEMRAYMVHELGLSPHAMQSSVVDGSGAQNLIITTPKGRTGVFAGLLFKQAFGIRDAWCNSSLSRREIDGALQDFRRRTARQAAGRAPPGRGGAAPYRPRPGDRKPAAGGRA